MANEQTSVPLFVADTILTAAQQNISAGTGVPVFATTVTRDAGFGGANKALAEGQLCYLSASNIVQYYDGAAWATVGPAASSALVCVQAETAFTASSLVSADSVFTSTYTNYLVKIIYTTSSTVGLRLKLRASGTATSTNYNYQTLEVVNTTATAGRSASATSFLISVDTNGDFKSSIDVNIFAPQLAQATNISSFNAVSYRGAYTTPGILFAGGNQSASTQFDGFQFATDSPGTTTGTYTIYGYSKAV